MIFNSCFQKNKVGSGLRNWDFASLIKPPDFTRVAAWIRRIPKKMSVENVDNYFVNATVAIDTVGLAVNEEIK